MTSNSNKPNPHGHMPYGVPQTNAQTMPMAARMTPDISISLRYLRIVYNPKIESPTSTRKATEM